ncbi:carboxylating nicotinate-nucleotide diphosphorylase [Candidatus Woesearchaeota archaeon]|nr:carboxylating nicotinate-nucleotide diphosphorylase [Candidatus Woesearchaeota archaeon]
MLNRQKLALEFWDRSKKLSIKNKKYRNFANKFLSLLLITDIDSGDLSTNSLVEHNKTISADIVAKEDGIFAGSEEFGLLNNDLNIKFLKNDEDKIKVGDILIELDGNAKKILQRERASLNLLQRMSGIATFTSQLDKKLNGKIKIAATRKTLWSILDKKAVSAGGGLTHRLNLNDGIIVKDNHLRIVDYDIERAINNSKSTEYIEIEVEDKKQALLAAASIKKILQKNNKILFAIMLDKIPPDKVKSIIGELHGQNLYDKILFEASGNINPGNLAEYADCGADIISIGCLTNPGKSLNMSLEIK